MGRYAVVDVNGYVHNVIEADQDFDPGEGLTLVKAEGRRVSPGDTWDGKEFIPAPVPKPDPNPSGFLEAAIEYLGVPAGNALLAKYPVLYPAVLHTDTGATALGIIDAMLAQQDITQEQYDAIQRLWDDYHMPRPEE